jgi:hypothetical protein
MIRPRRGGEPCGCGRPERDRCVSTGRQIRGRPALRGLGLPRSRQPRAAPRHRGTRVSEVRTGVVRAIHRIAGDRAEHPAGATRVRRRGMAMTASVPSSVCASPRSGRLSDGVGHRALIVPLEQTIAIGRLPEIRGADHPICAGPSTARSALSRPSRAHTVGRPDACLCASTRSCGGASTIAPQPM